MLKSDEGLSYFKISLRETKTTQMNSKSSPCKFYSNNSEFIECVKKVYWSEISNRINCSVPGLEIMMPINVTLAYCNNKADAQQIVNLIDSSESITSEILRCQCPLPCIKRSFSAKFKYFHKNSNFDIKEEMDKLVDTTVSFWFIYSTLLVEEKVESYVYDFVNMMTSLGGNLGLFLGFSCFSTLMYLINSMFNLSIIR
jgi:hypothetical protein